MKSLSPKQLQERVALQRDQQAYKQLFFYYYQNLCRFALGFVRVKEAAEEVVSDVMLKVWSQGETLSRVDNLTVYLYRATRNRCLNYIRDHQKHNTTSLEQLEDCFQYPHVNPEEAFINREWNNRLREAVSGLPPKCQMVYKLVREDGLSYKDVATIMEISENTVDRHLNNALHKMIRSVRAYVV
ncbi:MAG TPA: RNA polymerase sigma-70 factor [Flavisolibacter sp.]|jgi:RNA polymerase sigma-70 factor (ECF subfamily)|nr:RNA polymerase sigma-70 factor [Flavisolibacter sp.]